MKMKMIGYIKQKKALMFPVFAICLIISSGSLLAQEARPTDLRPPDTSVVPIITPEESERRLQDAKLLFDRGRTDAAIYMLQQLEKADPTNYKVLFKLGEMAIAARNWAYSINVLRKASFIRPEDVEVRLILMDVYTAYQMPIQEIIVGKEILVLDPKHIIATKRLAKLYQEQAMPDEEIEIRQQLKLLVPEDYENLKRLADAFNKGGSLWEAARIYEQIRKYYPDNIEDITFLASIYDKLGETFRELQVLDQLRKKGKKRSWLEGQAKKKQRLENNVYDPFDAGLTFRKDNGEEIDVSTTAAEAKYLHILIKPSLDVGVEGKLTKIHHSGRTILDGRMDIDSATISGRAVKSWKGENYVLSARLGLLWDEVHGRLRPSNPSAETTADDFPFLKDPSFNSYGGLMPVVKLKFLANPGLRATYQVAFEHGLVEDLDARLRMFYFDKTTFSYAYMANDYTEFLIQADESAVSDGNFRFHGLASVHYTLWGSSPFHSYRDRLGMPFWRKSFLRRPPISYLKIGYQYEYFDDESKSVNYEVYKTEDRHKYKIEAQARLYRCALDKNIILKGNFAYSNGSTLDLQRNAGVRLLYRDINTGNEIGLSYDFEEVEESNGSGGNLRVSGKGRSNTVFAYIKWRF